MSIRLSLLGEFSLEGGAGPVLPARGKLVLLLAYLARRSPERVRREELAALFWGDRSESLARQSLRHALLRLRRVVGDDVVRVTSGDVRLEPGTFELDVALFEAAVREGRWSAAVELAAGEFLRGLEATGAADLNVWIESERELLRQKLVFALDRLALEAEGEGDWSRALEAVARLAEVQPLDEPTHVRHMRLLRLTGRTADALAEHARVLHMLREEYGVEPGRTLHHLRHELEQPDVGRLVAAGSPGFVGRGSAFRVLTSSWNARVAAGGAILLTGEQGCGRTRLLSEFIEWVRGEVPETLVLHARLDRPSGERARDVLNGLRHARGLSGADDGALAEIATVAPAIRERFPDLPPPSGSSAALGRSLAAVLRDVAAEQPVLLALDDICADDDLAPALRAVVADVPAGVLVVATCRNQRAVNLPGATRVSLQALTLAETEQLLDSMVPMAAPARRSLGQRLHAWTGGVPGVAVSTVYALVAERRLVPDPDGNWTETAASVAMPLPLPEATRRRAREAVASLPPAHLAILEAVVILEADRIEGLLGTGVGDTRALDAALTSLSADGLLYVGADGSLRMVPCVRAAVVEEIPPARRASLLMRTSAYERSMSQGRRRRRRVFVAGAVLILSAVTALTALQRPDPELPSLAVGDIQDLTGDASGGAGIPLADLMATRFARLPQMDVVSPERMHELRSGMSAGSESSLAAARVAGARQIVQGSMYPRPGGGLRLELRRIDVATGAAVGGHIIDAMDVISVVDGAIAEIAEEFGIVAVQSEPERPASLVAYRMYEEGLRAYYRGDALSAHRFFAAALAEDSTFAMAGFYDWMSKYWAALLDSESDAQLGRVVKLAQHAGDRERLLISAMWADHTRSAAQLPLADTLAIRYPLEPDGYYLLGRAYAAAGDFNRAVSYFERVVAMDSVGFGGSSLRCRACDAMAEIVATLALADSSTAAERAARRWTLLQPGAARPWVYLASLLEYQGRFDEALEARRAAMPHQPANGVDPVYPAIIATRRGDFTAADRLLADRIRSSSRREQRVAAWFLVISLRQQGRHDEALRIAQLHDDSVATAVTLMEVGRSREAAQLFIRMAESRGPTEPKRTRAPWPLAHAASALADAGEYVELEALADSVEALSASGSHARNHRLAHYIRGRALAGAGRHEEAIAEYRKAMYSPSNGYALLNLHHARSLNALSRPHEAIPLLQAPFRGPVDAGNFYVPHTELRLELARAFDAAGMADSALTQYRHVLGAWDTPDARLSARRDSVRDRIDALTRQ